MPTVNRLNQPTSSALSKPDTYILKAPDYGYPLQFAFGENSRKVEGIAKLSQVFLKKLFTSRGSNPLSLNEGTEFPALVGSGVGDEEEALMVIQNALRDAEAQVVKDQTSQKINADETLRSASLAGFKWLAEDRIELFVNLVSEAGVTATVKLPYVETQG